MSAARTLPWLTALARQQTRGISTEWPKPVYAFSAEESPSRRSSKMFRNVSRGGHQSGLFNARNLIA
jgi:hypothetical protein